METQRALREMTDFWGQSVAQEIVVTNGFPSPMAMFHTSKISSQRSLNIKSGQIPVLILTASAVAAVQLNSFRQIIKDCAELLAQDKLRIIVQAGCGQLGKIVFDQLNLLINNLPHIRKNILLHLGNNADSAIDLFEAVAWGETPLILGVKGSEMCRMAVALNLPLIPTGAIGRHEFFNIYYSLLQGAPIYLLPSVQKSLEENLPQLLSTDEWEVIKPLIKNAACPDFPSAISKAQEYIRQGSVVPTNWRASLEILAYLCPQFPPIL